MELLCQPFICSLIGIGAFFPRFQSSLRPSVSIGYRQHPVFGIASLIASLTLITVEVSRNEGRGDNFWIATETDPVPDVDEIFVCISKDINARADGWVIRFVAPGAVLWHERPMLSAEVRRGSSRRCCLQLLLGFCAHLFRDNAGASSPVETTTLTHSIVPSVDSPIKIFPRF